MLRGFRVHLFRAFGIPIRLDASWAIVFALVTWSLATQAFPADPLLRQAGFGQPALFGLAALTALLLFVSLLLHELGHAVVAKREKIPIHGITLFLFGGVAELGREPDTAGKELRMAVAGPIVSAGLLVLFAVPAFVPALGAAMPIPVRVVVHFLAVVNGGLLFFNLIPGFPLDGGRVLRSCVWWMTGNLVKATRIATRLGALVGFGLIGLGIFQAVQGALLSGIWLGVIGLFIRRAARASYDQVRMRHALDGLAVRDVTRHPDAAIAADLPLDRFVAEHVPRHRLESYAVVSPAAEVPGHADGDDGRVPVGILDIADVARIPAARRAAATVGEVMRSLNGTPVLSLDQGAARALEFAQAHRIVLVIDPGPRGGFRGFLVGRDIHEAARLRADLGMGA